MHPDTAFEWNDREAMLAFLAEASFAAIFISLPEGPKLVHAPLLVAGPDRLRFHLSRRNEASSCDGARAMISCLGAHAYISPDWYGTADQVPTWNYVAIECGGSLVRLEEPELVDLLDDLSAVHERALAPKPSWSRTKMSPPRFRAMLGAIAGYELRIETLRGTRKLGQNKRASERTGAIAALRMAGNDEMATLMAIAEP